MATDVREQHATALPITRQPLPVTRPELATLAMQRFQCTGGACPDTCCRDFGITFDKEGRARMLSATAHSKEDRERVVRLTVLQLRRDGHGDSQVVLDDHGACPMLETSGHCELRRKYGESALGTVCSIFPRTSLRVGNDVEVSGSLACPELARLTLLAEDGVDQAESPTSILPRAYVGKTLPDSDESADPYLANFRLVRTVLREIFAAGASPLPTRLIVAAHLAAQVRDFFHAGTHAFAGKKKRFAQRRLEVEMRSAKDPAVYESLHRDLGAFAGDNAAVLGTVLSLVRQRLRLSHPPRFAALAANLDGDADIVLRRLDETSGRLDARLPGVVDRILARYAQHYLLRSPYTDAPNLLAYLGRLALSLGAIRALVLASPVVGEALASPHSQEEDESLLASHVAEVAQVFTKAVSHQADFLAAFHHAYEDGQGTTFGRLALFARFLR